jgi:hypothetical protein
MQQIDWFSSGHTSTDEINGARDTVVVLDWGNVRAPCRFRGWIEAKSSRTGALKALVLYLNRKEVKGGKTKIY